MYIGGARKLTETTAVLLGFLGRRNVSAYLLDRFAVVCGELRVVVREPTLVWHPPQQLHESVVYRLFAVGVNWGATELELDTGDQQVVQRTEHHLLISPD